MKKNNDFGNIEKMLGSLDFSGEAEERVYEEFMNKKNESVQHARHKKRILPPRAGIRTPMAAAFVTIVILAFSMTSFASELIEFVRQKINFSENVSVVIGEAYSWRDFDLYNQLAEGLLFDTDGNPVDFYVPDGYGNYVESFKTMDVYRVDGEKVYAAILREDDRRAQKQWLDIMTEDEYKSDPGYVHEVIFYSQEEAREFTEGKYELPAYIPDGFEFSEVQVFYNISDDWGISVQHAYFKYSDGDGYAYNLCIGFNDRNNRTMKIEYYFPEYKNAREMEIAGIRVMIVDNTVIWDSGSYIYTLYSDLGDAEIENIISSMQ